MTDLNSQTPYWDAVARTKTFTHPLDTEWLATVPPDAAVLDYGCGYGRLTEDLRALGFTDVTGVDTSAGMIDRARQEHPDSAFGVITHPPSVPYPDDSFDLVLLFAVLTCVPTDDAQRAIMSEIARVLRPGGLIYLSDIPLQEDPRSRDRYAKWAPTYTTVGVFETDDGAVCRHHTPEHFAELLADLDVIESRLVDVRTMNGNRTTASQFLAQPK